jgi:adhesin transport system membrane fusion protein
MEDNEHAFRSQAAAELAQSQGELAKLKETIPALEDRVSRTAVRSPMRGLVKLIPMKTVGGVVQPGSTLAEIVPVEETLLVEARIRPSDIAFVRTGLRAVVKLTAYDYSIYGGLDGRIEHVSADSVQPQQGEPFYIAHVRTSAAALQFRGKALPVIPGMTASVDVLTGRRTVLYYLMKPINRARERALTER